MFSNCSCSLQIMWRKLMVSSRTYARTARKIEALQSVTGDEKFKIADEVEIMDTNINARFLELTIGGTYRKWNSVLEEHPVIRSLRRQDIINAAATLKMLNFKPNDIASIPMVLLTSPLTLNNRYSVLQESGFENIDIMILFKYITVINKAVYVLKNYNYIANDLNVIEKLRSAFTDIELQLPQRNVALNENMPLKKLREQLLSHYLRQRLGYTDSQVDKLWRVYGRVRHKSFQSVQNMIEVLEKLNFSKERIVKNAYLLHGDVKNVERILAEVKTIDGQDIREIVHRRPKILMTSCDSLLKTLQHVTAFGIGEDAVLRCLEVLTLGPDTVLERLRDLNQIEEFQVLGSNPRVLRLVHYQNKARLRLEYLNQLKVRCASLHILSCGSEAFAKFARDGTDRTKGCDIVVYLSHILQRNDQKLRSLLSRHPNWCHIPVVHVKQCYEFLLSKNFTNENIYNNIHLLLYPITRIEERLQHLQSNNFITHLQSTIQNVNELTNTEILTLILYLIEYEFHFTGDGVWTEQHTLQVENFNNLLPDFPESVNKVYKYGVKPAQKK